MLVSALFPHASSHKHQDILIYLEKIKLTDAYNLNFFYNTYTIQLYHV